MILQSVNAAESSSGQRESVLCVCVVRERLFYSHVNILSRITTSLLSALFMFSSQTDSSIWQSFHVLAPVWQLSSSSPVIWQQTKLLTIICLLQMNERNLKVWPEISHWCFITHSSFCWDDIIKISSHTDFLLFTAVKLPIQQSRNTPLQVKVK